MNDTVKESKVTVKALNALLLSLPVPLSISQVDDLAVGCDSVTESDCDLDSDATLQKHTGTRANTRMQTCYPGILLSEMWGG